MRWKGREQSSNVEDRRGVPVGMAVGGGGIGVLVIALIAMFLGADPATVRRIAEQGQQAQPPARNAGAGVNDEAKEFVAVILKSTEDVWTEIFQRNGARYQQPKLIMFSGQVRSGCGIASAAVGPFYCPADKQVYIDPAFFDDLKRRHNAPGDFAQAYVIAHEVAHHVQGLLGFSDVVQKARSQFGDNSPQANQFSVRLELQADYLAGVWAHHAHKQYDLLERGDIEEGINAANQIGDDTLMRQAGATVRPDRFTHGSSAQRVRWFSEGLRTGDFEQCQQLFELDAREL